MQYFLLYSQDRDSRIRMAEVPGSVQQRAVDRCNDYDVLYVALSHCNTFRRTSHRNTSPVRFLQIFIPCSCIILPARYDLKHIFPCSLWWIKKVSTAFITVKVLIWKEKKLKISENMNKICLYIHLKFPRKLIPRRMSGEGVWN